MSPPRVLPRRRSESRPRSAVIRALETHGLLLKQDRTLPSVVGLVTGESLRGSWWSHPQGREIFAVLSELEDGGEALVVKLIAGKDTLVHPRLWPAVAAAGASGAAWQHDGLSDAARRLFASVSRARAGVEAGGDAARRLARRLLVVSSERHTESGKHSRFLESWSAWAARTGCRPLASEAEARRRIEEAAASLGAPRSSLPWAKHESARG